MDIRGDLRRARDRRDEVACSFCGRPQAEVAKIIAGPGWVFICDGCVGLADGVLAADSPAATAIGTVVSRPAGDSGVECSFCGKRRGSVRGIAAADSARICDECLDLCREILAEENP